MTVYEIRTGTAGKLIKGVNLDDVLKWKPDASPQGAWEPGPGGSGGGLPPGTLLDQIATWNPTEEEYFPVGRLADVVITKVADLEAHFPAVDGVHTITEGYVEFQAGVFDLVANRIVVAGAAHIVGWGKNETRITSTAPLSTVTVTAPGVEFDDIQLHNTTNGYAGQALNCNVAMVGGKQQHVLLTQCTLGTVVQDDPWSLPATVAQGALVLLDCTVGDSYIKMDGDDTSLFMVGGEFVVNNSNDFAITCNESPEAVSLESVHFRGSRAGVVVFGETATYSRLEILNCVEGYTGSLLGNAVAAGDLTSGSVTRILGNTFAGGISLTPSASSAVQIADNSFVAHQNERVPFVGFTETTPGVCCRNNYDSDVPGYLKETPILNLSYAFSSYAELEVAFPAVANVHTLDVLAEYTIMGAGFDLDGARIVLQTGVLRGQFLSTVLSSDVDDSTVQVSNDPENRVENITIQNTGTGGGLTRAALELTVDAIVEDCWLEGNDVGCAVIMDAGTLQSCTISGSDSVGVVVGDNNVMRQVLDCKWRTGAGDMIRMVESGQLRVTGARVTQGTYTNFVNLVGAASANTSLYASDNHVGDRDIVVVGSAQPHYMNISNNSLGQVICATADVPAQGLVLSGNDMSAAISGFAASDARVCARANFVGATLQPETALA